MNDDSFLINYPAIHTGTEKSIINFFEGTPDLVKIYNPGEKKENRYLFVTDATVASLPCMQDFLSKFDDGKCKDDELLILGSGEPYKTIESVLRICSTAVEAGFNRKDIFVGIGGGVICDITAFAASIFKRGAKLELVPTTLLAMVDASIGGKTGCDYDNYKNIIGTFFPAQKLYYWPEFVQYLPETQYNSGLGEAFKTAILFDKELFDIFKNESEKINSRDKKLLNIVIAKCVAAKGKIVEEDLTEKGPRALLNLGHTFGHALESIAGLGIIPHGAAVAWGIGRSVELAFKKEYCLEAYRNEIFDLLKKYNWDTNPIPSVVRGGGQGERFLNVMHKDKKNINSNIRVIISKGITETVIEEVSDKDILSVLK